MIELVDLRQSARYNRRSPNTFALGRATPATARGAPIDSTLWP